MFNFKKAEREKLKLRLAIEGPSGSGKTFSALRIATGLVGENGTIAVIDTENRSASLYSENFNFLVADLPAPYTPERFVECLQAAEKANVDCIIIDSISHEWKGDGGVLDIHSNVRSKNSFTAWSKVNSRHDLFLSAILNSPVHVIVTMRSKQGYVLNEHNGKQVPVKVGMQPVQRDGIEYEFTAVFTLEIGSQARGTKDRTQMYPDTLLFLPTEETGRDLKEWLEKGKKRGITTVNEHVEKMNSCQSLDDLQLVFVQVNSHKRDYSKSEMSQLIQAKDSVKEKLSQAPEDTPIIKEPIQKVKVEIINNDPPKSKPSAPKIIAELLEAVKNQANAEAVESLKDDANLQLTPISEVVEKQLGGAAAVWMKEIEKFNEQNKSPSMV